MAGDRVRSYCAGWRTLTPYKGNHRITQCDSLYGKAPTRQLHSVPIAASVSGHARKQIKLGRCHPYTSLPQKRSIYKPPSKAVLSRMQLTLHATRPTPHGASRLVPAMSAWSVKTRCAPSRHFRDARVYGHTTTFMHDMSTPHPPTVVWDGNAKLKTTAGNSADYGC